MEVQRKSSTRERCKRSRERPRQFPNDPSHQSASKLEETTFHPSERVHHTRTSPTDVPAPPASALSFHRPTSPSGCVATCICRPVLLVRWAAVREPRHISTCRRYIRCPLTRP
ncbi:hypothetical protein OF83DRAFT_896374 [Amylostereum chailletii]|nr:hypothetical protein OF83DRAFT_896374 [Amylostereum chailletii]